MNASGTIEASRGGVVLLTGYGIRVCVERGYLQVEDGVADERRQGRFFRAERNLKRLVVLGHAGTISFDALRWLSDIGAAFIQIDSDARVIAATGPAVLRDARVRRAQAQALDNGRGLAFAKELVRAKLAGQRANLDRFPTAVEARATVERALDRIDGTPNIERLRLVEADAGAAYWRA